MNMGPSHIRVGGYPLSVNSVNERPLPGNEAGPSKGRYLKGFSHSGVAGPQVNERRLSTLCSGLANGSSVGAWCQ